MAFTCVLQQEINGGGFKASSNGNLKGHDSFNTQIKYKSSLATFSREFSSNMTIDKLFENII